MHVEGRTSERGPSDEKADGIAKRGKPAPISPLSLLLTVLLAGACADSGAGHTYKLYPGPHRSSDELVVVRFADSAGSFRVDGMLVEKADYERVELLPGEHRIQWGSSFAANVLVNPIALDEVKDAVTFDLAAGHEYIVHNERTMGRGSPMEAWIQESATREIVFGSKSP